MVTSSEGLAVRAVAREFEIAIDESRAVGGTDTGMTPSELVLCALGACQTILAKAFAKRWGLEIQECRVELEGDLDPDGYRGLSDACKGFSQIRYRFRIRSDASDDRIRAYVRFIDGISPVRDTIANPVQLILEDVIVEKNVDGRQPV